MTTRILIGDVRLKLQEIPERSVHACVTSPPYYGLRSYLPDGHPDKSAEIGLESSLAEYIATMVDVFRAVHRVLRDDGTLWLNVGDSYNSNASNQNNGGDASREGFKRPSREGAFASQGRRNKQTDELKPKDLMMVPARLAIALQDDGWYLRSDIIWHKRAPMPESVTDRPTSAHEHIFLLAKQPRYYYDATAVAETALQPEGEARLTAQWKAAADGFTTNGHGASTLGTNQGQPTRNLRNVWTLGPEPFPEAHFATFPTEIPRRCIKAGTSEHGVCAACGAPWVRQTEQREPSIYSKQEYRIDGAGRRTGGSPDGSYRGIGYTRSETTGWAPSCNCGGDPVPATVLDPFLGSGTTLLVADQLGRDGMGVELNTAYAEMARKRIYNDAPLFANVV